MKQPLPCQPRLARRALMMLQAASEAMKQHSHRAPWHVFDSAFGRKFDGAWVNGPVDAYKVWCSATLFAAVAHKQGDSEVRDAALTVLSHFTPAMWFTMQAAPALPVTTPPLARRADNQNTCSRAQIRRRSI